MIPADQQEGQSGRLLGGQAQRQPKGVSKGGQEGAREGAKEIMELRDRSDGLWVLP